jgi:hypothetical protein
MNGRETCEDCGGRNADVAYFKTGMTPCCGSGRAASMRSGRLKRGDGRR